MFSNLKHTLFEVVKVEYLKSTQQNYLTQDKENKERNSWITMKSTRQYIVSTAVYKLPCPEKWEGVETNDLSRENVEESSFD